jgi:integrase
MVSRQKGSIEVEGTLFTAKVVTRHAADCKDADKGDGWAGCDCRKSVRTYDGTKQKQYTFSAKTRSWEKAQQVAEEWLDQYDPNKQETRKREEQAVTIEHAVALYLADMIARLGDNGTVSRARTLLGDVVLDGTVKRNGKLFEWLYSMTPRLRFITDIASTHLAEWRQGWGYGSDGTAFQSWCDVKTFFKFCHMQGWIAANPAAQLRHPKKKRGNRTGLFTDEQYDAILAKARGDQMLETFLELLRWSGMAMVDGVEFEQKYVTDGVLRYTRQKSKEMATVVLPERLLTMLRALPEKPFRRSGITQVSCIHEWRRKLQGLFKQAGITTVQTEVGPKSPRPHMLRDTFAVYCLRHGVPLYSVAKALGHSNPTITAKHYLPFVAELEQAHIAEFKQVMEAAKPKVTGKVRAIRA